MARPLCGMRGVAHRSTPTVRRVQHAGRVAGGAGSGRAGRAAAAAAVKSGGDVEAAGSRLRLQPRRRVLGGGDADAWVRRRWRGARASVGGGGGDDGDDAATPVQSDEAVQMADSGDAAAVVPYESKGWQRRYTMVRSSGAPGAPGAPGQLRDD